MNSFSAISFVLSRGASRSRISISRLVKESTRAWGLEEGEVGREGDPDRGDGAPVGFCSAPVAVGAEDLDEAQPKTTATINKTATNFVILSF